MRFPSLDFLSFYEPCASCSSSSTLPERVQHNFVSLNDNIRIGRHIYRNRLKGGACKQDMNFSCTELNNMMDAESGGSLSRH